MSSSDIYDQVKQYINIPRRDKENNNQSNILTQVSGTQVELNFCQEMATEMQKMRHTFTEEINVLKLELGRTQQKIECLQEMVSEIPNKINYDLLLRSDEVENNSEQVILLPITDKESFEEMDRSCEDQPYARLLTRKLITCGGESLQKATRRVINKLFSLELQRKINYSGKNNKIKLSLTNFKKIILDSVKDIRNDFKENTVEAEMKNYLQRGQERYKNFTKRTTLS